MGIEGKVFRFPASVVLSEAKSPESTVETMAWPAVHQNVFVWIFRADLFRILLYRSEYPLAQSSRDAGPLAFRWAIAVCSPEGMSTGKEN